MEQDMLDPRAEPSHPRATFFPPRALSSHHPPQFSLFNTYFFPMKMICVLQRASPEVSVSGALWQPRWNTPLVSFSYWTQAF